MKEKKTHHENQTSNFLAIIFVNNYLSWLIERDYMEQVKLNPAEIVRVVNHVPPAYYQHISNVFMLSKHK